VTAPQPPGDLARRDPLFVELPTSTSLHRFYTAAREPVFFDRGHNGRFNGPDGSYGVLYAAASPAGAFAETFLREPGRTLLPADLLARKAYVELRVLRALTLIRLGGPGLARVGATAEVVHGGLPYDIAQAWSAALYGHPAMADGIAYTARHDDEALCFALFDRASALVEEVDRQTDLDQEWFWKIAEAYGVGLAPP
jgi:hypothetical protein